MRTILIRPLLALVALAALAACEPDAADRVTRAQGHLQNGDYASAVLEARGALQDEPANLEARVIYADASRLLGDYRTAAAEYNRAMQLGLEDRDAQRHFADVLLIVNQPQRIIDELSEALSAEPKTADALITLARAYAATGDAATATTLYNDALAIDANRAEPYVGLADLARRRNDMESVNELLDQADAAQPGSPLVALARARLAPDIDSRLAFIDEAYANLSADTPPAVRSQVLIAKTEVHLRRNELDAASAAVSEYERLNPGSAQAVYFRSLVQFQQGDLEAAKQGFMQLSAASEAGSPADVFLGSINLQQSNLNQAEAYLNNALRYDANSVQARKLLAETLLQLGRSEAALEILASLGAIGDDDPALLSMLGRAAVASGDAERGAEYFERSMAADPENPGLVLATAYSHLAAGDADSALRLLDALGTEGVDSYRAAILRMLAHLTTGDREGAVAEAEQLIADNPDDPTAYSVSGQLMASLGDLETAADFYKQALEIAPDDTAARYGYARVLAASDDNAGAYRELTALLDAEPGFVAGVSEFESIATRLDKGSEVLPRIEAAIDAAPESALPRALLAQYYLRRAEAELARQAADEGLAITSDNPKLLQIRGLARLRLGQTEAGRADLERAAGLAPTDRNVQLDWARTQVGSGAMADARETAQAYLDKRPNDVLMQLFAADIDIRIGDLDRAIPVIDRVLAQDPENRAAIIMKGDVASQQGDFDEALQFYRRAADLSRDRLVTLRIFTARQRSGDAGAVDVLNGWLADNPNDVAVESLIAQTLDQSGDRAAAIKRYEEILEKGVDSDVQRAVAMNNLAWLYYTQSDSRALALADEARKLAPNSGAVLDTYAWILFESGRDAEALPLLRRAAELDPGNGDIRYHLAMAMSVRGETEQAIRLLEQTLAQFESFSEREQAEALLAKLR